MLDNTQNQKTSIAQKFNNCHLWTQSYAACGPWWNCNCRTLLC